MVHYDNHITLNYGKKYKGVGVGVVELATLIGSGLLTLLKMVTTTTNSLLFLAFHIKRLEASCVSGWRKVVYKDYQKAELATSN